jgi:hypothetical protein
VRRQVLKATLCLLKNVSCGMLPFCIRRVRLGASEGKVCCRGRFLKFLASILTGLSFVDNAGKVGKELVHCWRSIRPHRVVMERRSALAAESTVHCHPFAESKHSKWLSGQQIGPNCRRRVFGQGRGCRDHKCLVSDDWRRVVIIQACIPLQKGCDDLPMLLAMLEDVD